MSDYDEDSYLDSDDEKQQEEGGGGNEEQNENSPYAEGNTHKYLKILEETQLPKDICCVNQQQEKTTTTVESSFDILKKIHNGMVFGSSTSSTGKYISFASDDHTFSVWKINNNNNYNSKKQKKNAPIIELIAQSSAHKDFCYQASFYDKDQKVVSCSGDKTIKLWKFEHREDESEKEEEKGTLTLLQTCPVHQASGCYVRNIALGPPGTELENIIATCTFGGDEKKRQAQVFDLKTLESNPNASSLATLGSKKLAGNGMSYVAASFSVCCRFVATGAKCVSIFDAISGNWKLLREISLGDNTDDEFVVNFCPQMDKSHWLFTRDNEGFDAFAIYSAETGEKLKRFFNHPSFSNSTISSCWSKFAPNFVFVGLWAQASPIVFEVSTGKLVCTSGNAKKPVLESKHRQQLWAVSCCRGHIVRGLNGGADVLSAPFLRGWNFNKFFCFRVRAAAEREQEAGESNNKERKKKCSKLAEVFFCWLPFQHIVLFL